MQASKETEGGREGGRERERERMEADKKEAACAWLARGTWHVTRSSLTYANVTMFVQA